MPAFFILSVPLWRPHDMGKPQQPTAAGSQGLLVSLPPPTTKSSLWPGALVTLTAVVLAFVYVSFGSDYVQLYGAPPFSSLKFYTNITRPRGICLGSNGDVSSYAGYIGITGDAAGSPRRSFFW
jgi:hypothetical protein